MQAKRVPFAFLATANASAIVSETWRDCAIGYDLANAFLCAGCGFSFVSDCGYESGSCCDGVHAAGRDARRVRVRDLCGEGASRACGRVAESGSESESGNASESGGGDEETGHGDAASGCAIGDGYGCGFGLGFGFGFDCGCDCGFGCCFLILCYGCACDWCFGRRDSSCSCLV